jgi:2-polyprenyl-6-methoxyphenol hydroxylase-like FAD-dependent oxidoreductase
MTSPTEWNCVETLIVSAIHIREMRIVDDEGKRKTGFGTNVFREITGGLFVTVRRSDLARLLLEKAKPVTEIIFNEQTVGLEQDQHGVNVKFKRGHPRRVDLVIGADGLHSNVRDLVLGPQDQFERSLGYMVAAFESKGYRPRDEGIYIIHNEPCCMLGRLALREDRTRFLFVFAESAVEPKSPPDLAAQKVLLRKRFGDAWEKSRILDELDQPEDLYLDRVSQIHIRPWSHGRIALVGDAAFCVSLMTGQGSALAMTAAYVLAGELARVGGRSYADAFHRYESLLCPYIENKQRAVKNFSGAFALRTAIGLFVRNLVIAATTIPGLARLAFGRDLVDRLAIPEYGWR